MLCDSTAADVATFSSRNSGALRLFTLATLLISCLASSILPLPSSHLADSGINLWGNQHRWVIKLSVERWPSSAPTRCKQQPLHAGQPWWSGPVSSLWPGRSFRRGGTGQRRHTAEPSRRPRTSWTSRSTQWLQTRQKRVKYVGTKHMQYTSVCECA